VSVRPTQSNALRVTIRVRDLSIFSRVVDRVRHVFDLGTDTEPIETHLARDQHLVPLIAMLPTPGSRRDLGMLPFRRPRFTRVVWKRH
jgi:AlkA N-terminal domain